MKNLMATMEFEQDVTYIVRTNEEGPPIKCEFLRWEEHINSGQFHPIFGEETDSGWREFFFMGPVVLFDPETWDKLVQMPGYEGYCWLVSQLEE